MDFHGTKRKDLQSLCKKHGIPANLKNSDMATRLASLFEKETEEIVTETKRLAEEDFVEVDGVKDNLVVKKVRFSPDNEVFEFTRSAKKRKQRNVRPRRQVTAQNLQQSGIEVRRSTRIASKEVAEAKSSENESNTIREIVETDKSHKVARRSKRIGSSGSTQEEECRVLELIDLEQFEDTGISKGLSGNNHEGFKFGKIKRRSTRLIAKRPKGLVENELVKDNVKEVSMDFEVQDVQDSTVEDVCRRSRRLVSEIGVEINTQGRRKSMRLKASAAKESKEERKTKQSKKSVAVSSQEGELVKNKTKEPLVGCMKVQDDSKVEKVTRRSKRLGDDVNVLMDKKPLMDKAVNHDDLEVEKAPQQCRTREKSVSELLVVDQAQKGDCEDKKLLRRSKRTALDNVRGQAMANSPKRCSVIDNERDGAFVGNAKKLNVNDEMQVRVRFTRNSSRNGSCKAPIAFEGNLVVKKTDATLVKSSKVVARRMKRGRSAVPEKLLDENAQVEQEEAGGAIVDARGSLKKSKTMNQECVMDKPEGMIDDSPSSSENKAAEYVMRIENVLDSTVEKLADSSQRINTQELNSELMEGEREEKLERDTVLMALIEEEKEEVSSRSVHLIEYVSPAPVHLAATNHEAELVLPTGHTLVKDTASTVIAEENAKTKEQTLTCSPKSELLQDNPQGMAEDSPSTETKATDPVMISENVLDSTGKVSGDISSVRNTQECNSELMEGEHVGKSEQNTVLMAVTTDKEEASTMSVSIIECSEVKACSNNRSAGGNLSVETTPPPPSLQLTMIFPEVELGIPTGNILVTEEDTKTKEDTIVCTPRTELKEHSYVANLAKVEVSLENSAEILSNKDDEKGSPEKDLQAANSYQNFFDEHSVAEEEMEISKVGCMSVGPCENLTPQKLFDAYTLLEPEEVCAPSVEARGSAKKKKTANQIYELEKPQGMVLDSPSTSETKATEPVMISENELVSTPKLSGEISLVENIQDFDSELMEAEPEEKQEQDTVLMAATKDKEESSSLSVYLIERSEVSNHEPELFVETIAPSSGHVAVSHPEAELGVLTGHILAKDISSIVVPEEDIKTKEEILVSISRSELKEHNSVAKFAEAEDCLEEEEMKATSNALDESGVFTTPDRNLMLMEPLSDGKICAAQSVTHHNDELVESHAVVFTTPEKVPLMGDFELGEADKVEVHSATEFPDECDVLNTTEKCFMSGGFRKNEARNERESIVVERHDDSNIATSPVRQSSEEDLKGDGIAEDSRAVVLTTPEKVLLLGDSELDVAEKEEDHTASENEGESIVVELHDESNSAQGDLKGDAIERNEENRTVEFPCDSSTCTSPDRHVLLVNLVSHGAEDSGGSQVINRVDKSGLLTSLEKQLLYGEIEQKEAVKTREIAADESTVPNIPESSPFPEDSELNEAAKSEENMAVELQVEYGIFTSAEKKLLLQTDEEMKGDNITAKSHVVSDVIAASEGQSIMGDFKPENTDVELLSESNISTNVERHLLFGDCGLDGTRKETICEESCVFTSPERRLLFGISELHNAGKQEHKEVEFKDESAFFTSFKSRLLLGESGQDRFDIGKSDLSHHASSPKVVLKENSVVRGSHVAALEFTETTNSDSNGRTALPAKDNSCEELRIEDISETMGEISSHLEVAKTCSMVSGNNEADELIEAEVTKNNQTSFKENLTFYLAGSEDEHLGFDSEVDFPCEKSGHKSLADEATDPLATTVEEAISVTVQNITNELVADETTPMNENWNTDESGTLSEKQVRREPLLIYGTQVKTTSGNNMKENAPNSKTLHHLNITAPRMTKRKPLQDLMNN